MPDWFSDNAPPEDDWFASNAPSSRSASDILYDPNRKPASTEDFAPKPSGWPAKIGDVLAGALKGVGSTAAGIGETAVNAGLVPGVTPSGFNSDMRAPIFQKTDELTTPTNTAQKVGKYGELAAELAAPAVEAGKVGLSLAKAAPALIGKVPPIAVEVASHLPVVGGPVRLVRGAAKVLGHVMDLAGKDVPAAANAGGRLVSTLDRPTLEAKLADALAELRAPRTPNAAELPPVPDLPPGYTPRTTVPDVAVAPAPPANAGGRLVPAQAPTLPDVLTQALADTREPIAPKRITTSPEPSLPPNYQPRTTVPKPKMIKASMPAAEPTPAAPPKRAYFLKSQEDIDAAKAAKAAREARATDMPSEINQADLPASWRTHTDQDIFPMTGAEGKAATGALRDELKARGVSVGEAISLISRNKTLPTDVKFNLIRSLNGGAK